jgi:hypothetical protein
VRQTTFRSFVCAEMQQLFQGVHFNSFPQHSSTPHKETQIA